MNSIEQRLERLEKQNRLMKRGGGGLLVVLAAVMLMGYASPGPKQLETEALIIKDAKGNDRAWLCVDKNDVVRLSLLNTNEKSVARLEGREYGADLTLSDADGERRIQLTANSIDPCLRLFDDNREVRVRYPESMEAGTSKKLRAMTDIILLKAAVQKYRLNNLRLPDSLLVLREPDKSNVGEAYLGEKDNFLDPWGNEYLYIIHSSKNYDIVSWGSDNAEGGRGAAADISSRDLSKKEWLFRNQCG